jgi:hypothetical protein
MLAAGFSAFAPSTMPEAAAANANLFVSAENSQFQNYFSGPMVIEVVIIDSTISDTDEAKGEPDVTVNGNKLRMIQGTDGNWYAYVADRTQAQNADGTVPSTVASQGLDFGEFCSQSSTIGGTALFSQTVGFAVARSAPGGTNGTTTIGTCTIAGSGTITNQLNNVVRENKTLNQSFNNLGLNGSGRNLWPIIQLYDFTVSGNVVIQYNKGGGVQSTTLTFDTVEGFIGEQLDRNAYPRGAQVHYTITDIGLNIDPTDEDSWTFQANSTNKTTVYQAFNENGGQEGDGTAAGYIDISASLGSLMVEDGFQLELNVDTQTSGTNVVALQDNADTATNGTSTSSASRVATSSSGINTLPITLTESAPNTAVFNTFDETDVSQVVITSDAPRGKSATITYDDPLTILVGFGFGTIDIQAPEGEWNSGEDIPVVLTDSDANKNSRADEDLDLFNPDVDLIPSLRIGSPFTLGNNGTGSTGTIRSASFGEFTKLTSNGAGANSTIYLGTTTDSNSTYVVTVQKFSDRAILTSNATSDQEALLVGFGKTATDLQKTVFDTRSSATKRLHGFDLFNYDIRGIVNSTASISSTGVDVYLAYSNQTNLVSSVADVQTPFRVVSIANDTSAQGLVNLNSTRVIQALYNFSSTNNAQVGVFFTFPSLQTSDKNMPIVADFFSFGYLNDGFVKSDRVNNYIARIEAEETGDNTATFGGSLEYVMLNQLNILDASTYTGLTAIADDPSFIAHQDLDAEEAPRVNYLDLGADGVSTQIADQQDAPAHSGVVSFDKATYKIADTVLVTLQDQDLNTDVDLIDIFTVVNDTGDAANSLVG